MKETLICSLEKHNIYYLSDANVSFYILAPYKEYDNTNISIRLKSNYDSYDLTKNSLEVVTNELINYYKNLDNYNITLILPVFYNNIFSFFSKFMRSYNKISTGNIYQEYDIENHRNDPFFQRALGLSRIPAAPSLRQRLDLANATWDTVALNASMALIANHTIQTPCKVIY